MVISTQNKLAPKSRRVINWRFLLALGLSVKVGTVTARVIERNFESGIGHWCAFLVGWIAALSLAGFAVYSLIKPNSGD
jgi:hypothetical protein